MLIIKVVFVIVILKRRREFQLRITHRKNGRYPCFAPKMSFGRRKEKSILCSKDLHLLSKKEHKMETIKNSELRSLYGGADLSACIGCGVGVVGLVAEISSVFTPAGTVTAWWAIGHIATVITTGLGCGACLNSL